MSVQELIARTLERANEARVAIGKEPLAELRKGTAEDPDGCPLALSLDGGEVTIDYTHAVFPTAEEAEKVRAVWDMPVWDGALGLHPTNLDRAARELLFAEYRKRTVRLPADIEEFPSRFDHYEDFSDTSEEHELFRDLDLNSDWNEEDD
jgi:hypothetical protein